MTRPTVEPLADGGAVLVLPAKVARAVCRAMVNARDPYEDEQVTATREALLCVIRAPLRSAAGALARDTALSASVRSPSATCPERLGGSEWSHDLEREPFGDRWTTGQAAERLGCDPRTVRRRATSGALRSVRQGGRLLVSSTDVLAAAG